MDNEINKCEISELDSERNNLCNDRFIMNNFDPDNNVYNSLFSFYPMLLPEEISLCKSNNNCSPDIVNNKITLFSIIHINSRSLLCNINEIYSLLNLCNNMFSVICITETWLNESSATLASLPNFNFVSKNRNLKAGGGVGFFIKESLKFITRDDLQFDSDYFESMVVEIFNVAGKSYLIIVIYRPPNTDPFKFFNDLSNLFKLLKSYKNKPIYILGDFNIDLLKNDYRNVGEHFISLMNSFNFVSLILSPTRITGSTSSLIDNIFTNNYVAHSSGTISSNISDHLPVFTQFEIMHFPTDSENLILSSNFCQRNLLKLNHHLHSFDWNPILNCTDVDIAMDTFITFLQNAVHIYCPHSINKKSRRFKQPWMSKGLLKSSKVKNKLYRRSITTGLIPDQIRYLKYKNLFTKLCKISENKYYLNEFAKRKNNFKRTWDLLKSCMGIQKLKTPLSIDANGISVTDDLVLSNIFNNHFISSFKSFNSLANNPLHFKSYLGLSVVNSFFMLDSTQLEIIDVIKNCKNSRSEGMDHLSNYLLKQIASNIVIPLQYIFNLSFNTGHFPISLKTSKVIPLFKSGDKKLVTNYRPISLVSCLSKIMEKLILSRLIKFLENNHVLVPNQYGFRSKSSTEFAIVDVINFLSKNIESKQFSSGIFLDLSKAFDSLDHFILLQKLHHYGVRGVAHDWFCSYLKNRYQYVCINGRDSEPIAIQSGVPQGSILGPLLFNIFINDFVNSSKILKFILFADDTTILHSHSDIDKLSLIVNKELVAVYDWISSNNLRINLSKTCFIIFGPKIRTNTINIQLIINENEILRVDSTKFLGITICSNLSWAEHILNISNKISKNLGIMYRLKNKFPNYIKKSLYNSLILPYFIYCVSIWGYSPKSHLEILNLNQNSYLRILFNLKKFDHISSYRNFSNILLVKDLYIIYSLSFLFKIKKLNYCPQFNDDLVQYKNFCSINLRKLSEFYFPTPRTNYHFNSVLLMAMRLWNMLPIQVKNSSSMSIFKKHIRCLIAEDVFRQLLN